MLLLIKTLFMFMKNYFQPAVEAFFLVHSSSSISRDRNNENTTENRDREAVPDLAPVSPIYSDSEGTAQSEVVANTSWDINPAPQKTLPPDQLKFLKFAGNYLFFQLCIELNFFCFSIKAKIIF